MMHGETKINLSLSSDRSNLHSNYISSKFFVLAHFDLRLSLPNSLYLSGFLTNTILQCYNIRKKLNVFFEMFSPSCGFWNVGRYRCIVFACRYRFTHL